MAKLTTEEILKAVEEMTVLELNELVKALEEKFGVSAAMMAAPAAAGASTGAAEEAAEEKTSFDVEITSAGANKIAVIKVIRELVPTLGLTDAKAIADSAPKAVLTGVNKEAATEAQKKLTEAGATVTLK